MFCQVMKCKYYSGVDITQTLKTQSQLIKKIVEMHIDKLLIILSIKKMENVHLLSAEGYSIYFFGLNTSPKPQIFSILQ